MPEKLSDAAIPERLRRDIKRIRGYLDQGNLIAAAAAAEASSQRFGTHPATWYWRAVVEQNAARHKVAIAHVQEAIRLDAEQPEFFAVLAQSQLARGDVHLAVASAMRSVSLNPEGVLILDALAEILHQGGALEQALALIERALSAAPSALPLLLSRAHLLRTLGRRDDAEQAYEAVLVQSPNSGRAHWGLTQLGGLNAHNHHLERLDAIAQALPDGHPERSWIDYARYIEHEALGNDAVAIEALLRGAADQRQQIKFEPESNSRIFARMKQLAANWEKTTDRVHTTMASNDAPVPVFIVGMPRSGIKLAATLLGQNPDVQHAGESREFATCLQRVLGVETGSFLDEGIVARMERIDWNALAHLYRGRLRQRYGQNGMVTETLPANYIYAAAIARALPEARLLRVIREPMDNCFSLFRQIYVGVNPFSFDQLEMAQHYAAYEDWMRQLHALLPDRLLSVRYEQLVSAPALVGRAVFRFCGLDWQDSYVDAMLGRGQSLPVQTGPAIGVLHEGFVGRWRRYENALEPLQRLLSAAGLGPRPLP